MSKNKSHSDAPEPKPTTGQLAIVAQFLLSSRRRRNLALPAIEFGEPAWDIILELYLLQSGGRRNSVSNLCDASVVAESTALRWIRTMADGGQLVREPDTVDRRRVFVALAPDLLDAITDYLGEEFQRLAPMMLSLSPSDNTSTEGVPSRKRGANPSAPSISSDPNDHFVAHSNMDNL